LEFNTTAKSGFAIAIQIALWLLKVAAVAVCKIYFWRKGTCGKYFHSAGIAQYETCLRTIATAKWVCHRLQIALSLLERGKIACCNLLWQQKELVT